MYKCPDEKPGLFIGGCKLYNDNTVKKYCRIHLMPYCIPDIIIRDIESQKPVAVIDAKYKPNTRSARSDTHQLLSYVLLTDVKRCGFVFPGVNSCAKIMDATETVSLPLAVDSLDYYELILGNDLDGASEALRQVLP